MDRHKDTLMDRQIERGAKRQTDILIDRQKDGKKTDRQKDRDRQKRPTKQRREKDRKNHFAGQVLDKRTIKTRLGHDKDNKRMRQTK